MSNIIDLRGANQETRTSTLLSHFDSLPSGGELTVLASDNCLDFLLALQEHAPGAFEWHPMTKDHKEWLLLLTRRTEGASEFRQILEFMSADHQRVRQLLDSLLAAVGQQDREEVATLHTKLEQGLDRHFAMEEELVLPLLERNLGPNESPTPRLIRDHKKIRALVESLGEDLLAEEWADNLSEAVGVLVDNLSHHSALEDRILYGQADVVLTPEERNDLVKHCQRL